VGVAKLPLPFSINIGTSLPGLSPGTMLFSQLYSTFGVYATCNFARTCWEMVEQEVVRQYMRAGRESAVQGLVLLVRQAD